MSNYSEVTYDETQTNTSWHKLFKHIPEGARVLDFGCSSGNLGAELKKAKQCVVIGVDIDKADVKLASKKLDESYVKNIETDDFTVLGKFDRIIFADVLEHLIDPVAVLKKVKKLLKPQGCILFSIPNMAHMGTRLMLLEGKFGYGETGLLDKTHLHFYDEAEVRRIFIEAGLLINEIDWTEYYIPQKEIKNRLASVGLAPKKQFLEESKNTAAVALQYVGSAFPSKETSLGKPLPAMSPWIHKTDEYITMVEQRMEQRLLAVQEELKTVRAEYDKLLRSKSWKVTKPLRVASRIKKVRR